jgi:hypothetical protein
MEMAVTISINNDMRDFILVLLSFVSCFYNLKAVKRSGVTLKMVFS